jgi:hypothetical protein
LFATQQLAKNSQPRIEKTNHFVPLKARYAQYIIISIFPISNRQAPIMMIDIKNLLFLGTIVATNLPTHVISMQMPNGYMCNLCHSLQNDHPFPPPSAQDVVVRFSKSENEQFGLPWDRGVTCLEVWDIVLDYANPNVFDEQSCRAMAAAYAPQCCNDIFEDSSDNLVEQMETKTIQEEDSSDVELAVEEALVVSKVENSADDSMEESQSLTVESTTNDDIDEGNGNKHRRATVISHLRTRK